MQFWILLIHLLTFQAFASVQTSYRCEQLFVFEPPQLLFNDPIYVSFLDGSLQNQLTEAPSLFLGMGVHGVVHLQINPKTKKLEVEKHHFNSGEAALQSETDQLLLSEFLKIVGDSKETFHFAQIEAKSERDSNGQTHTKVTGPFVPGRTLHNLLISNDISEKMKTELRSIYARKLQRLYDILKKSSQCISVDFFSPDVKYFKDRQLDATFAIYGQLRKADGTTILFIIKSDNLLVHPQDLNNMTIVDPY